MRLKSARQPLSLAAAVTLLAVPSRRSRKRRRRRRCRAPGYQDTIDLGSARPGQDVPFDVYFTVTCSGMNHVDANQ